MVVWLNLQVSRNGQKNFSNLFRKIIAKLQFWNGIALYKSDQPLKIRHLIWYTWCLKVNATATCDLLISKPNFSTKFDKKSMISEYQRDMIKAMSSVDRCKDIHTKKVKRVKPIAELLSIACHMRLHSVTCHLTEVNVSQLNPSQTGWYSIYLPRRDGRLSWPECWLYMEMVNLSADITHPGGNHSIAT